MAGHILLTHVFQPYIAENIEYGFTPAPSPSNTWFPTLLTTIMEEDETEEAWEDLHSIPTIMKAETEVLGNAVRASASHDSLLAVDSDEWEYSQVCGSLACVLDSALTSVVLQYCLPSDCSAASELSEVHAASFPPRPIVSLRLASSSRTTG